MVTQEFSNLLANYSRTKALRPNLGRGPTPYFNVSGMRVTVNLLGLTFQFKSGSQICLFRCGDVDSLFLFCWQFKVLKCHHYLQRGQPVQLGELLAVEFVC